MSTPIDPRHLSPTQHAALFDAVRREAAALRRQAIADAFGALIDATARQLARPRTLLHVGGQPLHRSA